MGYEHLVSEASENHVAVVGRHDLDVTHPDVPAHLIEITRIDLGSDPDRAGSDREDKAALVYQFLAD